MPSVNNLQITITNDDPRPNGQAAAVKPGGTVKWFGADSAYSLTLPASAFPGVSNPVSVPSHGWSSEITVSSSANGEVDYSVASASSGNAPREGQPKIIVSP